MTMVGGVCTGELLYNAGMVPVQVGPLSLPPLRVRLTARRAGSVDIAGEVLDTYTAVLRPMSGASSDVFVSSCGGLTTQSVG